MNRDGKNKGNSLIIINVYHEQDSRVARSQNRFTDYLSIGDLFVSFLWEDVGRNTSSPLLFSFGWEQPKEFLVIVARFN